MTTRNVSRSRGHLYQLLKTVQFDVELGDDSFALRVELFQAKWSMQTFRDNIWRTEFYQIQSTFPQNPSSGRPKHRPSDEVILIDWSTNVPGDYSRFEAASSSVALNIVLNSIRSTLDRATGGKFEW